MITVITACIGVLMFVACMHRDEQELFDRQYILYSVVILVAVTAGAITLIALYDKPWWWQYYMLLLSFAYAACMATAPMWSLVVSSGHTVGMMLTADIVICRGSLE